jgi:hypothetical protein
MRRHVGAAVGMALLVCLMAAGQRGGAQEKPEVKGTLKVKIHYKGAGKVDDKHKVMVFLFDSPEFMRGSAMPFTMLSTDSKDGVVTFPEVAKSPVYVGAIYDPKGVYDGVSGPPPSGASMGAYSSKPGEAAPVNIAGGKTASVEVSFDDSVKMQ